MLINFFSPEERRRKFSSTCNQKETRLHPNVPSAANQSNRMLIMLILLILVLLIWGMAWSQSQISRADLAVRLVETEACWEAHRESTEARLRAAQLLSDGVTAFFSGKLEALVRNLTLACASLRSEAPSAPEMLYAGTLGVHLPHVVDKDELEKGQTSLGFKLFSYYEAEKPDRPQQLQLHWQVRLSGGKRPAGRGTLRAPEPGAAATLLTTRVPEGDYEVLFELRRDRQSLRRWRQTFSVIANLKARLEALEWALRSNETAEPTEKMTVLNAWEVLDKASKGQSPETFYPLLRLLQLAERITAGWEKGKSGWQAAPGDYWLATLYRERKVAFRLFIPEQFKPNQQIPLVLALHGAGGNEHLFFEGYGLGIVLKEAEKRGWAVIAPRAEMGLVHIGGALEAAQRLLSIDPGRIYLMGHSMGGAHSFSAIAQFPELFRAVAIFAGVGQPTQVPPDLPIMMAIGEQELSRLKTSIENAYRRLQELNLKTLKYKKYEACDHLMIVREALPDAFAFFDRAPAREATSLKQ
jgi:pimeloyl-ACP methyl ester carboxylesterase